MAKLSPKQTRFIEEYLIDLNATQAAIRAGYSPNTANEQGSRLLANVSIKNEIDKAMAERSKRTGINQDRVLIEIAKLAFVKASDVIDIDTAELNPHATSEDLSSIQSVKVKTIPTMHGDGVEREIKLTDKLKALELLGKHLGMFKEKVEINGNINTNNPYEGLTKEQLLKLASDEDG